MLKRTTHIRITSFGESSGYRLRSCLPNHTDVPTSRLIKRHIKCRAREVEHLSSSPSNRVDMAAVAQYAQGHTPHDRLSYLLNRLCDELDGYKGTSPVSAEVVSLAQQAKTVIDGYDGYLQKMSSPHPPVVDVMIEQGNKRDWDKIYYEGKTKFKLLPEMTAGGYEAVVLQHLAKLAKVRLIHDDVGA